MTFFDRALQWHAKIIGFYPFFSSSFFLVPPSKHRRLVYAVLRYFPTIRDGLLKTGTPRYDNAIEQATFQLYFWNIRLFLFFFSADFLPFVLCYTWNWFMRLCKGYGTLLETWLTELQEVPVWSENEWPGYLASIARYCSTGATYGAV